jgi:hydroxymethylbilane synthase
MPEPIRIATRQSPLALWQANTVRDLIRAQHPELKVELLRITTKGDRELDRSLAKIGGKGLFIKELETALYDGSADLAVHSMKDVTATMPDGLFINTVLERHNPLDALVSSRYTKLQDLPDGAIIGTCSPRRQAQLLNFNPTFKIRELRGNVGTRLSKLDAGEFDATLLACAGLERLGLHERIAQAIDRNICLPAVTQGTIGIEIRENDDRLKEILAPLNHVATAQRTAAERAFSSTLNGGCSAPIAGYATINGNGLTLTGRVVALDGSKVLETTGTCRLNDGAALGKKLALELNDKGAQAILAEAEIGLTV